MLERFADRAFDLAQGGRLGGSENSRPRLASGSQAKGARGAAIPTVTAI